MTAYKYREHLWNSKIGKITIELKKLREDSDTILADKFELGKKCEISMRIQFKYSTAEQLKENPNEEGMPKETKPQEEGVVTEGDSNPTEEAIPIKEVSQVAKEGRQKLLKSSDILIIEEKEEEWNNCCFNWIPDEILIHIFSFLELQHLWKTCQVSKR